MVTHPFDDHARSLLTLAFESEYSCSALVFREWVLLLRATDSTRDCILHFGAISGLH